MRHAWALPRRVPDRQHPGRADGEALRPGWVAQPVSAVTSSAFCCGAAILAGILRGARGTDALAGRALAVALAANGVGSAGFHGPGDRFSRALHDMSLWAVVTVCLAGVARGARRDPWSTAGAMVVPVAMLAAGAAVARRSRTGGPWCRPDSPLQGHALWHLLAAAGITLAGRGLFAPGRVGTGRGA